MKQIKNLTSDSRTPTPKAYFVDLPSFFQPQPTVGTGQFVAERQSHRLSHRIRVICWSKRKGCSDEKKLSINVE